jgi:excinuclease ABC subunit C
MDYLKDRAVSLPDKPGVYLMLDKTKQVIYVGKAKNLYNRVTSYFRSVENHDIKTRLMVSQVSDFDYIVTDTEFEALVLENSLIKRHKPKYNILLKDDKGYPYIRLSVNEEYPRFSIVSKPADDGAKYFGPYRGRVESRQAIEAVCAALKLPTCKRRFPRDIGKGRPCLNRHLGKCRAVCMGKVSREEYLESVNRAVMILEGKSQSIAEKLKERMNAYSAELKFEAAARVRDEIRAIENLGIRQKVLSGGMSDTDVIAVFTAESKSAFSILHYLKGELLETETRLIETPVYANRGELISGFVKQYYGNRSRLPKSIWLSDAIPDAELIERWLSEEKNPGRVKISVPARGEKLQTVRMAEENAKQKALTASTKTERINRSLEDLGKILNLEKTPVRIEAYDISHTAGADMVSSMIVFENGAPAKNEYRKFTIKTLEGSDDCAAMRETVARRIERYLINDEKFNALPDLILVDGGKAQVNTVYGLLSEYNIGIPVFGMVKDDRHRTRAIITHEGSEVGILSPGVFRLIVGIQEEVHRFAVSYHKKLRSSKGFRSGLTRIPGIGEERAKVLLKRFKSIDNIKNLSITELCEAVPKNIAENIYRHYHSERE